MNDLNTVRFSTMKVSDIPTNREVRLPDPLTNEEENKLAGFRTEVMKITERFIEEECSAGGRQRMNLHKLEEEGIESLHKICLEEDLVVMETDKSKRLSIMTMDNYIECSEPLVKNDVSITQEEQSAIERSLNGHTLQLTRAFAIAFEQGDFIRIKKAMTNYNLHPPPLHTVRNDHKYVPQT